MIYILVQKFCFVVCTYLSHQSYEHPLRNLVFGIADFVVVLAGHTAK